MLPGLAGLVGKLSFPETVAEYVSNIGASQPVIGPAVYPASLYDSGSNMTWLAWESWNNARIPQVAALDHDTGYWTDITDAGLTTLVDDDHGTPALCLDDEGYLHCFHGSHNTDQRHSSSRWAVAGAAGAGSLWRINDVLTGFYTYPHPVLVGSDIYLLLRAYVAASPNYTLVLRKTATLVAGLATWNAEITLVNFGVNTRFYVGSVEAVGTDIHIVATKADATDTLRENVYYFVYDTVTGAVKNHDASSSVASGSLPVTLAQADANFKLFDHAGSNDDGGTPALCFDTSGDPHVLFKDGTASSYAVKHIKRTAGVWDSPVSIATVDSRYNCPVPVALSSGRVEAWYPLDPLTLFTRFGNMVRRERSAAGVWGGEETIVTAGAIGLGNPSPVMDGHTNARVLFCEAIDDAADASAGDLRLYLWGHTGLIAYRQAADVANAGAASGHELREDGDDCLREDGSFELRETA